MKTNQAIQIIGNALTSYIEDCSGQGTSETKFIDKAWDHIQDKLRGDDAKTLRTEVWKVTLENLIANKGLAEICRETMAFMEGEEWITDGYHHYVAIQDDGNMLCYFREYELGFCTEVGNRNVFAETIEKMVTETLTEIDGDNYRVIITNVNN